MESVDGDFCPTMRILVISPVYPPMHVAEADHAFHLCDHFSRQNADVHVLTTNAPNTAAHTAVKCHPIMRNWSWSEIFKIIRLINDIKPDVVFILFLGSLYKYKLMITAIPGIIRIFSSHIKCVTMFTNVGAGGGLSKVGRWLANWVGKYKYGTLLTSSNWIFALSERSRDRLLDFCPDAVSRIRLLPVPAIVKIAPTAPDQARSEGRDQLGLDPDTPVVSYFGRIYPGKGLETLYRAFNKVLHVRPDARLLIIGGDLSEDNWLMPQDYAQSLADLGEDLKINDSIIATGEYPWDSDIASICLYASDLCVLPFDGGVVMHSSSLSGAVAHGLPIVATQKGELEAPLENGVNGLFCRQRDPDAMAELILKVLDDPKLRARLRAGALKLAAESMSWDATLSILSDTLELGWDENPERVPGIAE
jgi:glycosyltransferase involved in cell wall biosynthesis